MCVCVSQCGPVVARVRVRVRASARRGAVPQRRRAAGWLPGDGHEALTLAVGAAVAGALLREGVALVGRSLRRAS